MYSSRQQYDSDSTYLKMVSWYTRFDTRSSSNLLRFPSDRGGGNTGGPTTRQTWIVSHFGFVEAPAPDRPRDVSVTFEVTADDGRFPFFVILAVATRPERKRGRRS